MDYSICDENVKEHWDAPQYVEHWHFPQFHRVLIPYMIATNCEEVAMYVNGKRYYLPKPVDGMITGFTPWQAGCVQVVGYRNGEEVCTHSVKTPGTAVKLQFARDTITLPAQEGYEKLITVEAADEEGNPYFRESSEVRFVVEGPARIVAVDHGNLMSNEPYGSDRAHMYRGKVSVLLRLDGTPGRVVLSAFADGMYSARLNIIIQGA
jgi:beta-galactosidase